VSKSTRLISQLGPTLVIILALIPLIFWYPYASFSSTSTFWLTIGQFTALTGYSLFCLNFLLSARLKFLEPFFAGLNRIYIFHHLVGVSAFILLLLHPLSILLSYLYISARAVLLLFTPSLANFAVYFGIVAIVLFVTLLLITLYGKLEYDTWKLTHKFLGLALFLASIHVFFIGSTLSVSPPLKLYLFSLTILSLTAYSYRVLFPRFLVKFLPYTVAAVRRLTPDILEISLAPASDRPFKFAPGQFIFVKPRLPGILGQSHPFSLTNPLGAPKLTITPKMVGDYTGSLKLLKPKTPVLVEGPFGWFSYVHYSYPRQVWIAGGIGITPFVSMATSLIHFPALQDIHLYYAVKDSAEAVYVKVFTALAKSDPRFHFHLHTSASQGRLTAEKISRDLPDLISREVFVCGPPPMMKSLRTQLRALGLKNSHIHSEEFSLN